MLDEATGDEAALTLDYTTNKAAGNDTGLLINQTDTLSNGISKLLDLQVGGTSKFSVNSIGRVGIGAAPNASFSIYANATVSAFQYNLNGINGSIYWGDLALYRDAANTLAQRQRRQSPKRIRHLQHRRHDA